MPKTTGENTSNNEETQFGIANDDLESTQTTEGESSLKFSDTYPDVADKIKSLDNKTGAHELIMLALVTIVASSVILVLVDLFNDTGRYDAISDKQFKIEKEQNTIVNCLKYRKTWQYEDCLKNL